MGKMSSVKMLLAVLAGLLLVTAAGLAADQSCPWSKSSSSSVNTSSSSASSSSSRVNSGYLNTGMSCPYSSSRAASSSSANNMTATGLSATDQYSTSDANALFDQLRRDHRTISTLIGRIMNGSTSDRQNNWTQFRNALLPHMQAEERVLYPALQSSTSGRMSGLLGEEEHGAASCVFVKLDAGNYTNDRWMAQFQVLSDLIRHHVSEEESKIFTAARRAFNNDQLRSLYAQFMEQRQMVMNNVPPPATSAVATPASLSQMNNMSSSDMSSQMYDSQLPSSSSQYQSAGFEQTMQDVATDQAENQGNMTLRCSHCGAVVGVVCPLEEAVTTEPTGTGTVNGTMAPNGQPYGTQTAPNGTAPMTNGTTGTGTLDAAPAPVNGTGTMNGTTGTGTGVTTPQNGPGTMNGTSSTTTTNGTGTRTNGTTNRY